MPTFTQIKKDFALIQAQYEAQEKEFLNDIFFYLADISFELQALHQDKTKKINQLSELTFSVKNYTHHENGDKLYLDLRFNHYVDNVNLTIDDNNPYLNAHKEMGKILCQLVENTIFDKNVNSLLLNWLKQRKELKINYHIFKAEDMLENQFSNIWGNNFKIEYEKHKLENVMFEENVNSHSSRKIKI